VVGITAGVVCCYVPVGSEPGSLELITSLADAGRRVLLPVVVGAAPLDWAFYSGPDSLAPGPYGLLQPSGPALGAVAIGQADLVLVPALAVDRAGHRIGRGGGHYDRSLPLARPGTPLVAVVRDDELVDALPHESHDVLMTAVLTPIGGHLRLG
jgi:5-formyltetrahydrofolate cyclo-ligase